MKFRLELFLESIRAHPDQPHLQTLDKRLSWGPYWSFNILNYMLPVRLVFLREAFALVS